jgi:DNA-binding winged helix-turn-helix (wHTH) protein/ATP/maltotriose-dependent transcriptional regulator MalT
MVWRFDSFELDEERRELRLRGREVIVEPLVFDLLVELVRNRERLVTKDELLDRIWPGAIVTEGSLQRAVSLARSALRAGGLADAIRTFPRRGYRFDAPVTEIPGDPVKIVSHDDSGAIARARYAFEHDEWKAALEAFQAADHQEGLAGADLERAAWCRLNLGDPQESILWLERAAAAHSVAADSLGAARAALLLCQVHLEGRRASVAGGWQQRAMRLLAGSAPCRELAQFEWVTGRLALANGDVELALIHGERALEMARSIEDPDLEAVSLIYLGHVCVARGEVRRGLELHDEAAAAVLGGPVAPWFAGLVYCGLVYICQNRGDWARAAQWTDAFGRWSDRCPTTTFPAVCRLHRAEVLALRGELATAERELIDVRSELEQSAPWAVGDAERLYGEVLRARGDLNGAEQAYRRAQLVGWDSCPGWAELLIERKDAPAAVLALERAIADPSWPCRQRRRLLLIALARAAALAGDTRRAQEALDTAVDSEDGEITPVQQGALERARAELSVAEGRSEEAIRRLRSALRSWRDIGATLEIAPVHERLAELLQASGDAAGAALELATAEGVWREAGSLARAEACSARRLSIDASI